MRPSSYPDRNRYVNKPLIINTAQSPPASLLPRARIINTSAPSILRPTIRHNSYYYPPATIIQSNRNNRSSYHQHNNSSSYHHHHHRNNNKNNHPSHQHNRTRNRSRNHHHHDRRHNDGRSRSRSRNRDKRHKSDKTKNKNKHKSILDNRFNETSKTQTDNDNKCAVIESRNEFANKYRATMNKYYNDVIAVKLNNYYNHKLNPRFMIENDESFRNRIAKLKGLNTYELDEFDDHIYGKNNLQNNREKGMKNKRENSKNKTIFNSKGKSSMNYKFRAFKKSSQPNSFVQTAEEKKQMKNNSRYLMHGSGGHGMRGNIHVNDDDIYISRGDGIDMNELINGLVYSAEYQDHRIGTLNTAQNDYSQYCVDTRQRPSNFIRELQHIDRLKEYPKLRKLMQSKNEALRKISCLTPPFYVNADLKTFDLLSLQCKFDVILVDPPWRFYVDRCPGVLHKNKNEISARWSFEEMAALRIQDIAENPSFLFLWSGSGKTLNEGRLLLKKWGYKRCEVIVWLKTNKKNKIRIGNPQKHYLEERGGENNEYEGKHYENSLFVRSYEHCLMGIRGQVRRSTDGHLIHANVDTDVIITECAPYGSTMKPNELYDIIERFCLGRKRLELFGRKHNLRPGWLTISNDDGLPENTNYDPIYYNSLFANHRYVPSSNEIEALRPKSPIRNNQKNKNNSQNSINMQQAK